MFIPDVEENGPTKSNLPWVSLDTHMVALVGWAVPTKRQNTFEFSIRNGSIAILGLLDKTVARLPLNDFNRLVGTAHPTI